MYVNLKNLAICLDARLYERPLERSTVSSNSSRSTPARPAPVPATTSLAPPSTNPHYPAHTPDGTHQQKWQTPYKAKNSGWIPLNSIEFSAFLVHSSAFGSLLLHWPTMSGPPKCNGMHQIQWNSIEFNRQPNRKSKSFCEFCSILLNSIKFGAFLVHSVAFWKSGHCGSG